MLVLALLLVARELLVELWVTVLPVVRHEDVTADPRTRREDSCFLVLRLRRPLDHTSLVAVRFFEQAFHVASEAPATVVAFDRGFMHSSASSMAVTAGSVVSMLSSLITTSVR